MYIYIDESKSRISIAIHISIFHTAIIRQKLGHTFIYNFTMQFSVTTPFLLKNLNFLQKKTAPFDVYISSYDIYRQKSMGYLFYYIITSVYNKIDDV